MKPLLEIVSAGDQVKKSIGQVDQEIAEIDRQLRTREWRVIPFTTAEIQALRERRIELLALKVSLNREFSELEKEYNRQGFNRLVVTGFSEYGYDGLEKDGGGGFRRAIKALEMSRRGARSGGLHEPDFDLEDAILVGQLAKLGIRTIAFGGQALARAMTARAVREAAKNGPGGFLTATDLAALPKTGIIDSSKIRFSQNNIGLRFKDPAMGSVEGLAARIKLGLVDTSKLPPIRIVAKDGMVFTLDNRRLKAFQLAGVKIRYEVLDKIPAKEFDKFTNTHNGVDILFIVNIAHGR